MTKKIRDFLFRLFVFLFVIITISLSLYATGYRFNLSWPIKLNRMLLKTGALALDTAPKNAIITVSSETKISAEFSLFSSKKNKVTPVKVKNLLPGEYTVTFNLDGYWPYQKKVRVNPEQTTFLEDVILFRKSLPLNVLTTNAQNIDYSPNKKYAWLRDDKKIINLETEEITRTDLGLNINWTADNKQVSDGAIIINLENGLITDYTDTIGSTSASQLSNDLLIYQNNNNLATLNTKTKASSLIPLDGTIITYKAINNNLFVITSNQEQAQIRVFDLQNKKFTRSTELLNSKSFSFNLENNNLVLADNEHKIAYVIALSDNEQIIKEIIRGATVFKWLDNNKLAYASESEIYIYDLAQSKSYLITRLSEQITSLGWSTNNYLVYSTNTTIGTINLANGDNDITVLWQSDKISSLYLNNKSGVLYFSGAIGQQSGLYKITLK